MSHRPGPLFFGLALLLCSAFLSACANETRDADDAELDPFRDAPRGPDAAIFAANALLGTGINLGNALEAPREGDWGLVLEAEWFEVIADAGFDSVRVPIRWSAHTLPEAPYTIDPEFFARIDWVLKHALAANLAVILNMHNYDEIFADPEGERLRFLAIWKQIADHYREAPGTVFFELLNEPHDNLGQEEWNRLLRDGLAVIRQLHPERPVLVGPVHWNNVRWLEGLQLPSEDRHLIVTVHYYYPYEFTHQGAAWMPPEFRDQRNVRWLPTPQEQSLIESDFDRALAYSKQHHRPVNLGEFGTFETADMESRIRWSKAVARAARERGFSLHYWEFGAGFGLYDREAGRWRTPLLEAVLP